MIFAYVDTEIKLFLLNESFAETYHRLVEENREFLSQWLSWPGFCYDREHFDEFIKQSRHGYVENKSLTCAIEYQGEIVGNCSFNVIDQELRKGELGYWLAPQYQGKGIMTRVCCYLINYGLKELDLLKVEVAVAEGNKPSRAVCERLGLKVEGIISNREKVGERILSHVIYAAHEPV